MGGQRPYWRFVVLLLVPAVVVAGVPMASAGSGFDVSISVPNSPTAGEEVTMSGSISVPERPGDWEADVTVHVSVDGTRIATRHVTVRDGETTTISLTHTFESGGSKTVKATGETSFGSWTYRDSESVTVDVQVPETPSPVDPDTPDEPSVKTLTGAAFPVPAGLQDELQDYRENAPAELPNHAFVLATDSKLYVVFTESVPRPGLARVSGAVLSKDAMTMDALAFGAVAATETSFETTGEQTTLNEIAQSPDAYAFDLVRVSASHQTAAVLGDSDGSADITSPTSMGVLTSETPSVRNLTRNARIGAIQPGETTLVEDPSPRLWTLEFRMAFWSAGEETVDGIVIPPDTAARTYLATVDATNVTSRADGEVMLYLAGRQRESTTVDSVTEINAGDYTDEVVSVTTTLSQTRTSTQELLTRTTPCGDDAVPIKEVCSPVPNDVLVHTGVAWSGSADSDADVLLVVGASSIHQDKIVQQRGGEYRIVGRVVSARSIHSDLPDRRALVVYDLSRTGDVSGDIPERVASLQTRMNESFQTRLDANVSADFGDVGGKSGAGDGETATGANGSGGFMGGPIGQDGSGFGVGTALAALLVTLVAKSRIA